MTVILVSAVELMHTAELAAKVPSVPVAPSMRLLAVALARHSEDPSDITLAGRPTGVATTPHQKI